MTHVLITGGAGFIGSHLADAYLARGWRVSVLDNLSTGSRDNVPRGAELIEADLSESAAIVARLRPDIINHHAAQMDVRKSVADPAFDAEVNVVGSLRLLEKAKETGVKRFIFASSGGATYGEPLFVPQTEEHPARPMSPYGCAKLAVEHYMNYYRDVFGLSTAVLRYANVYGPRQSTKGEAGVVAIFARRLLAGQGVTINGEGDQTRDFVLVSDVVRANLAVTDDAAAGGAHNVGTGVETSVNELYAALSKIVPESQPARHGPAKAGEQMRSVIDGSRFAPYVPLEKGLRETVDWFRSNP